VIVLVVVLWRERAPRQVLTSASVALAAMVAQGVLGYVQYAEAIPALLVGFHVAGAVLVFGAVQWLVLELRAVPVAAGRDAERVQPRLPQALTPAQPAAARRSSG
jgi:heme A synthase